MSRSIKNEISETRNWNSIDEPGVINKSMIIDAYLADGSKGEEFRLHRMEPIVYKNITSLRLNYKNILRIDHLWVLPNLTKLSLNFNRIEIIENLETLINLKELDLSFNYIEKIMNLDKLINLEVLTLFNNLIAKIENLDKLEQLIIFSIGNNMVDSTTGIERLRFLTHLKVLNLEGNPICKKINMANYVAAILPDVQYYDFIYITDDNRKRAKEFFYRELRDIEANEEIELKDRTQLAKKKQNAKLWTNSFVAQLSENPLFESLWTKIEKSCQPFMLVGSKAQDVIDEYRKEMYNVTQCICKLGLVHFSERQTEIDQFTNSLERDHLELQEMGKIILDKFIEFKEETLEKQKRDGGDNNIEPIFNEKISGVWQKLMRLELHLHEATEEITTNFEHNIQNMITHFVEEAQQYFSQLRDLVIHFTENAYEMLSSHMATALMKGTAEKINVAIELIQCLEDENAIKNVVEDMKKFHIQQIEEYEDQLILQNREFLVNLIDKLKNDELKRNRLKVMEIDAFLDAMNQELQNLPKK